MSKFKLPLRFAVTLFCAGLVMSLFTGGAAAATGDITTVAGGFTGDGNLATEASVGPNSIFLDGLGNLYIADPGNRRIRKVEGETDIISTA